jgi:hypothetical protein
VREVGWGCPAVDNMCSASMINSTRATARDFRKAADGKSVGRVTERLSKAPGSGVRPIRRSASNTKTGGASAGSDRRASTKRVLAALHGLCDAIHVDERLNRAVNRVRHWTRHDVEQRDGAVPVLRERLGEHYAAHAG